MKPGWIIRRSRLHPHGDGALCMQLFAPSLRLYLFKSCEKECVCGVCVWGRGIGWGGTVL